MATLSGGIVDSGKPGKRKGGSREGFRDENKQTFLPPKSSNKLSHWKKKMKELGHTFAG